MSITAGTAAILGAASAVGAGLSYSGTYDANKRGERIANKQMEQQERLYHEGLAWNENQIEQERLYNSPANQRQLYEQAGFNPYLMLDGSMLGNSSAGTAPSVPSAGGMPQFQNPARAFEGLGLEVANIYNQFADVTLKNEQAIDTMVRRAADLNKMEYDKRLSDSERQYIDWQKQYLARRIDYIMANDQKSLDLLDQHISMEHEKIMTERVVRQLHESGIKLNEQQIIQSYQQCKTLVAQAYQAYQAGNESAARAILAKAQAETENALRAGNVTDQTLKNGYNALMFNTALDDYRFNFENGSSRGNPFHWSHRDFSRFRNIMKESLDIFNPFSVAGDAAKTGAMLLK